MPYIGNEVGNRFVASKAASVYSGDGSTTAFTLEHAVGSDEDILVSVDGVIQEPSVAYAVSSGTTLTFTAAPSSNSGNNIFVYYLFRTVATVDHPSTSSLQATDATFSAGVTATTGTFSSTLNVTGETTLATHLNMGDGDIIKLGAGSDLQIYHTGAHSLISDQGTGSLILLTNQLDINNAGNTENMITATSDGAVSLFHNNSKKIETTSSGADVSGTQFNLNGGGSNPSLNVKNNDTYYMTLGHDSINVNQNALKLKVNGSTFFQMDSGGHITMGSQPAFLATPSSSQANIPINAVTTVAFGNEIFDQNGDFASNTFTAPVTGKYQLQYTATYNSPDPATDYVEHLLITSNRNYQIVLDPDGFDTSPLYHTFNICLLADMDASDTAYIRIQMNNSGSSQMDISTSSYFSGYLVC